MVSSKLRQVPAPLTLRDCSLDRLERVWLSAHNQAEALSRECQLLESVVRSVEADWRVAKARLAQSEALRDALASEFMSLVESGGDDLAVAVPPPSCHSAA